MKNLMQSMQHFVRDEEGATAIEYGLLAALIAVVIAGTVQLVGVALNGTFTTVQTCLSGGAC